MCGKSTYLSNNDIEKSAKDRRTDAGSNHDAPLHFPASPLPPFTTVTGKSDGTSHRSCWFPVKAGPKALLLRFTPFRSVVGPLASLAKELRGRLLQPPPMELVRDSYFDATFHAE